MCRSVLFLAFLYFYRKLSAANDYLIGPYSEFNC